MISRFTDKTDDLLIQESKTQRLTILEQQYQMKQQALQKATDLISLLSDQLQVIKRSSTKTIQTLKVKIQQLQLKNHCLQRKHKQLQQLISYKQSRIIGIPPLSRRSFSADKKQTKSRIKQQTQLVNYSTCHMDFLKNLTSTLITKIFQNHKQVEYILNSQLEIIDQKRDKVKQYQFDIGQLTKNIDSQKRQLQDRQQLFKIISQQQQIINRLKYYINISQSINSKNIKQQNVGNDDQLYNLVDQLKILMDIVTQNIRVKSNKTRSTTDYRISKGREIQAPYQYIARMEALVSKQKYLIAENKELKNIIEGLISHVKR